jgi:hypothetical protein
MCDQNEQQRDTLCWMVRCLSHRNRNERKGFATMRRMNVATRARVRAERSMGMVCRRSLSLSQGRPIDCSHATCASVASPLCITFMTRCAPSVLNSTSERGYRWHKHWRFPFCRPYKQTNQLGRLLSLDFLLSSEEIGTRTEVVT